MKYYLELNQNNEDIQRQEVVTTNPSFHQGYGGQRDDTHNGKVHISDFDNLSTHEQGYSNNLSADLKRTSEQIYKSNNIQQNQSNHQQVYSHNDITTDHNYEQPLTTTPSNLSANYSKNQRPNIPVNAQRLPVPSPTPPVDYSQPQQQSILRIAINKYLTFPNCRYFSRNYLKKWNVFLFMFCHLQKL